MNLAAQQQLVGNESGGALDPWRFPPLLYEAMETADTRDQLMRAVLNVIRDTEYVVSCWAARREAAGALVVWDDRITADGHVIDSATTRAFAAVEDETLVRACQNSASVLLEHIPGFQAAIII